MVVDETPSLLRERYELIGNRCRRDGADVFETRLMLRRAICMSGPEGADVFYADDRFTRRGALPPSALTVLQDYGSVSLLDGPAQRHCKELFLRLMTPGRFDRLVELAAQEWDAAVDRWQRRTTVVLHDAVQEILCRAVSSWAGVPLDERDVRRRTPRCDGRARPQRRARTGT